MACKYCNAAEVADINLICYLGRRWRLWHPEDEAEVKSSDKELNERSFEPFLGQQKLRIPFVFYRT